MRPCEILKVKQSLQGLEPLRSASLRGEFCIQRERIGRFLKRLHAMSTVPSEMRWSSCDPSSKYCPQACQRCPTPNRWIPVPRPPSRSSDRDAPREEALIHLWSPKRSPLSARKPRHTVASAALRAPAPIALPLLRKVKERTPLVPPVVTDEYGQNAGACGHPRGSEPPRKRPRRTNTRNRSLLLSAMPITNWIGCITNSRGD